MCNTLKAIFILFILSQNLYSQLLNKEYKNLVPKNRPRYQAKISLDFEDRSFKGEEKISFEYPFANNKGVFLRLFANSGTYYGKNLSIVSVKMDGTDLRFDYRDNTTIEIKGDFRPRKRYTIDIEFQATLPEISDEDADIFLLSLKQLLGLSTKRMSENNYGVFGCSSTVCNMASPIPTLAKISGDDWNISEINGLGDYQRGDFADYHVSIISDPSVVVITNGIVKKSEKLPDGRIISHFEAEVVNDFVIEASDVFKSVSKEIDNVLYTSYYTSEIEYSVAELSIEIASQAINYFSKYYAKYPYTTLKIVSAPMTGGAGGVEFPALITVGNFLYSGVQFAQPEGRFTTKDLLSQMFEFVIVHEVAHQWFSTLVPSDSRREPFLDEGLASFSAYLYFMNKYGEQEGKKFLENHIRLNYIVMRLLGYKDLPISTPIDKYDNMFQYAGIIYGKAPLFFVKLNEILGDLRMMHLLSSWVRERAFKDSEMRHLISMLKKSEQKKVDQIESLYKRWFEGTYGDEDIGKGSLNELLKLLNEGEDFDINLNKFKDWLEDTFDMFRQYR
ncbi:MAG: M1 family aminopeptidase [Deltaproteobacteria bacterium]|nr:M1 family aminopeptidase [Deltaproteobacteria bacterium]